MGLAEQWKTLRAAEDAGFDAIITADQGIRYQQNLTGLRVAIIVLSADVILTAIGQVQPGVVIAVQLD
jgi:hypothetical protein